MTIDAKMIISENNMIPGASSISAIRNKNGKSTINNTLIAIAQRLIFLKLLPINWKKQAVDQYSLIILSFGKEQ